MEDIEGRTVHVTDTFSKPRMSYAQLVIIAASVLCVTVGARKPNVLGIWMVACVQFMVWTIQKHNFVSLDCFICAIVP